MEYAVVTVACHDMNGFANLGRITIEQYHAAPAGPQDVDEHHSITLDRWDKSGHVDDKFVSVETAAELLGIGTQAVIPFGRARLEEINAADEQYCLSRQTPSH